MIDPADRFQYGAWLACTKPFPAKFPTRCAFCHMPIRAGDRMVGVFSKFVKKAWMHKHCAEFMQIPDFVGK